MQPPAQPPAQPAAEPAAQPAGDGSSAADVRAVPRRVRVVSPRMSATRRPAARPAVSEIDEQTGLGEVYMRSLIRSQLRLALGVLVPTVVLLGGLPLLLASVPAVSRADVLGMPLPWFVLGVLAYPLLWLGARHYVRHAERNEAEFTDVLRRR